MTTIPPRDRALLDHAESIRSLVMDNHQLRCERDAAQSKQWEKDEEIERLRKALEEACDIADRLSRNGQTDQRIALLRSIGKDGGNG